MLVKHVALHTTIIIIIIMSMYMLCLQANYTYNDDKHICAGIFKACSLLWSTLAFLVGVSGPILITVGVIYRNEIVNYFSNPFR